MRDVRRSSPRDVRWFGATLAVATVLVASLAWYRGALSAVTLGASVLLAAAGVFALTVPSRATTLYRAWMALGRAMGRFTTPVLLVGVFALVLMPIGLLLALFRRDPLEMRRDPSRRTYFRDRPRPGFVRSDFERLS